MSFDFALPQEWCWETVDTVKATGRSIVSGPFGSNIGKRFFVEEGVPVIRGNNLSLSMGRFNDGGFVFLTEEKAAEFKNCEAHPNDLLFTAAGTIGQVGIIPLKPRYSKYIISNKQLRARLDPARIQPLFAYYWFASPPMVAMIQNRNTGSTIPLINLSVLKSLPIPVPPLGVQNAIVSVLSALDDRITLLRETNAILEAIAQALFKSWFVDFDPVHAKAQGITPEGMDEATAALFPDSFEESELGLVPKGWKVGELSDVVALRNERTKPTEQTARLPYVPIESITAKVPFLQEYKSGEEANSSLILFHKGDILFGAMRPYFHKVCVAPYDGVTRTTVFTLTAKSSLAEAFALFLMYQESTVNYATQHSEGSTIPYAKWNKSLEEMPIILPPESVQVSFSKVVSSFVARSNANVLQAKTLATLRDALLPRLISGQLRLPDTADIITETLSGI